MNKYNYLKVIQFNGGGVYGWEDVSVYDRSEHRLIRHDLREYRLSGYGSYRVISRRELNK